MHHSLVDIEKTYSGLTNGCAKAGKAGCKLVEITGDNASGDDVKELLNYAHDVTDPLLELSDSTDFYSVVGEPRAVPQWLPPANPPRPSEEYVLLTPTSMAHNY